VRVSTVTATISGLGVLSPAGRGTDVLAEVIREGRCLLERDEELCRLGTRASLSARIAGVDETFATLAIDPAAHDFFGRGSRIGAVAALDALTSANQGALRPPPIGRVIVASAVGPMCELEACFRDTLLGERHSRRTHAVTRVTPSFLATFLAGFIGAPRGGRTVSSACVSAIEALRDAIELVESGREEACLVGAVDEDAPATWWAFDAQRLLGHATSTDERTRSLSGIPGGFAPSGGAAFFVVESDRSARARGRHARELVQLRGAFVRAQAHTASLIAFPSAAYRAALVDAHAVAERIDLVLAHAPPTVADRDELALLDDVFGVTAARTPVRSFKSIFGYSLGAAAAIDVALGVRQLLHGEVLPNDRDARAGDIALTSFARVLDGPAEKRPLRSVLKTAYAQGGIAGTVVLERADVEGGGPT
jgi:3-oxoacyl-(acyl-carrier-protein) synthase